MPGTHEKLVTLLEKLNSSRSDQLDLSEYTLKQLNEKIHYGTSIEDAMKTLREIFGWRIKDWEYDQIEKELGW